MAPVEFDHGAGHAVQEIAVVRTEEDSRLAIVQVFFEPENSLVIQMVRRFVQDQQIARYDEGPRQAETLALAPGEGVRLGPIIRNAQLLQDDPRLLFELPGLAGIHFFREFEDGSGIIAGYSVFIAANNIHDGQIAVEDAF